MQLRDYLTVYKGGINTKPNKANLLASMSVDELTGIIKETVDKAMRDHNLRNELPDALRLYDIDETATILKITVHSLRRRIARGDLHGRKLGNQWLFSVDDIKLYLSKLDKGEVKQGAYKNKSDNAGGIVDGTGEIISDEN